MNRKQIGKTTMANKRSRNSTGDGKKHSQKKAKVDCYIQTSFRLQQLETSFKGFQFLNETDNGLQHRSFCRSFQHSTSNIHKLASRSRSISVQCSPASLGKFQGLCFPPFCLIAQRLKKIKAEKTTVVLATPSWMAQPCDAILQEISIQHPILLPTFPRLLQSHQGESHPMIQNKSLQLVGWLV
ncbi:unnamed protein product [Mytilus coruscus]|uniref:Uncharacterized protein n=1 Tax=Mytilus coruscus TaxID=42192 RepID=A0A6J8E2M1_MYTCO|nr:unnamed protein product [Mytilus coruscus]